LTSKHKFNRYSLAVSDAAADMDGVLPLAAAELADVTTPYCGRAGDVS